MKKVALRVFGVVCLVIFLPVWLLLFFLIAAIAAVLERIQLYVVYNGNRTAQKRMNHLVGRRVRARRMAARLGY